MTIGDRVKECRIRLGYSAEQVAERLGISPATEYRYENGDISKMPAKLIAPLAEFLSTTPAFLMGWSDEKAPDPASIIQNDEEQRLLTAYRGATPTAREIALETLENHQEKKGTSAARTASS